MIRRLFRQDPALRTLSVSCSIALVLGLWVVLWQDRLPAWTSPGAMGGKAGWLDFGLILTWFFLMLLVATVKISMRSAILSLALPIRPRVLWMVRMAAILLSTCLPLAVLTLMITVRDSLGGALVVDTYILGIGGQMAAGLVLTIVLLQQPFASLYRIEWSWAYTVYGFLMAGIVLLIVLASPVTWLSMVILLALALALGIGVYLRLPASFAVVDAEPDAPPVGGESFPRQGDKATRRQGDEFPVGWESFPRSRPLESDSATPFPRLLFITIVRHLLHQWQSWLLLLGLFLYGFIVGDSFREGKELVPFLIFPAAWTYGTIGVCARRLSSFDPLPVSRRRLFLYPAVSALVVFLLGVGLSEVRQAVDSHPPRMINYHDHELHTPAEFCEIAWDGIVPEVSSPWGERYTPGGHRVLPGSPAVVYDPYEHGPNSSLKFIAFQVDRSIEAVHGVPVPATYSDPDYRLPEGYADAIRRGAFTVEGSRNRTSEIRFKTYGLGAAIVILVLMPVYVLALLGQSATPRGRTFRWLAIGFMIFVVGVMAAAVVLDGLGLTEAWAIGAFPWICLRYLSLAIPLHPALVWTLIAAAVAVGFFPVRRAFERMEVPVRAQPSGFEQEF